ncbi:hypothetical protein PUN28_012058 [Cardiocondyla obscurior]|uniref:Uncharacterized protein n=1 Tax=Cardiocondyla obscurior TaxID=286306 RepID=A0AAW2FBW0_9HYME
MSSKRRTFHVDWDSPSHETGTVKRRPASMSASFSASLDDRYENVEYYELQDCVGGLRRLKLTSSEFVESITIEDIFGKIKNAVGDNKNHLGDSKEEDNNSENFKASSRAKQTFLNDQRSLQDHSEGFGEWEKNFLKDLAIAKDHKFLKKEISDEADKRFEGIDKTFEEIRSQDLSGTKADIRKVFGLKLYCEPIEWKSTVCRAIRRSESLKSGRSLIPRPKVARTRGLVNSSSESSGFDSPLSPLSPQFDALTAKKETTKDIIKTSDSKSSGIGSPGSPSSPLSPESQKYSAFHLIQLQLEKLRNCSCEKRQAEVIFFL